MKAINIIFSLFILLFIATIGCDEDQNQLDEIEIDEDKPDSTTLGNDTIKIDSVKKTPPDTAKLKKDVQKFRTETIVSGLSSAWGMAFLPDGKILVTERRGVVRVISNKTIIGTINNIPNIYTEDQGGLLDIELHPQYQDNGWIYFTYSKARQGGASTALARAKLENNTFIELKELFVAEPAINNGKHFGSRIAFDNKGNVFVSLGDRDVRNEVQKLSNHVGKVIRLKDDGSVPTDNPFFGDTNAKQEIWSYGHRNPQGLFYNAETNQLFEHEHGPQGGDELNIIEKGKNYGWPVVTYGVEYGGSPITNETQRPGIENPLTYWVPTSIAPSGLTGLKSNVYPAWKGNLFMGALAGQHLVRVKVYEKIYLGQEKLLNGEGRIRAVKEGRDGYIYLINESKNELTRIVPE
jgi:aldose sugar dehydrogenase